MDSYYLGIIHNRVRLRDRFWADGKHSSPWIGERETLIHDDEIIFEFHLHVILTTAESQIAFMICIVTENM